MMSSVLSAQSSSSIALNDCQNIAFSHDQVICAFDLISVPAYLPYKTVSPAFTVTGSSFLPGPAAITVPRCGFSFAVSGIIIPPAVFSSAAAGFHNYPVVQWGNIYFVSHNYMIFGFNEMKWNPAVWQARKGRRLLCQPVRNRRSSSFRQTGQ